jgi:hypothetical protein
LRGVGLGVGVGVGVCVGVLRAGVLLVSVGVSVGVCVSVGVSVCVLRVGVLRIGVSVVDVEGTGVRVGVGGGGWVLNIRRLLFFAFALLVVYLGVEFGVEGVDVAGERTPVGDSSPPVFESLLRCRKRLNMPLP